MVKYHRLGSKNRRAFASGSGISAAYVRVGGAIRRLVPAALSSHSGGGRGRGRRSHEPGEPLVSLASVVYPSLTPPPVPGWIRPPSHFPLSLTLIDRVSGFVRIQLKVTGLGIFYYYGILELSSVFCDVYLRANKKTLKLILSDLLKSSDIWGNILTL